MPCTPEASTVPFGLATILPKLMPFELRFPGHRPPVPLRLVDRIGALLPKVLGDLVSQHFLKAEPEQMGRVAAVRSRGDVAAEAGRTARPPVTGGARVGKTCRTAHIGAAAPDAVIGRRPVALSDLEFSLKELTAAPDRARRIARYDEP
jgi:hypothetical protein